MPVIDRRLLAESRVARRQLVLTVLFGVAAALLLLAQAGFLSDVLADASAGLPAQVWRGSLLGLALVVTARTVVAGGAETTALRAAEEVRTGLRGRVVAAVLRQGPAGLGGRPSGELTALLTRGLDTLDVYVARFLPSTALAVIVPPVVLVRIAVADWLSALILLLTAPLVPVFMALVGRYTRARTARQWRLLAQLGGHFLDVVAGLPTLTVFGRADAQVEVIREVSERHRRTTLATLRIAFTSALVLELLATVGTALVAVAVGLRLLAGGLDYRTALLVLLLAPEVYLPLRALGGQFHASADGVAAADEVFARLDEAVADGPAAGRPLPAGLEPGAIEFDQVSLSYPGRPRPALDAVGFTVRPGSLVVLDGPVGSGKSSVLSLLMRFAQPTAGEVRIDGHRLADLDVEAWRRRVGWVSQTPYLFAGSLADNVRLGRPGAGDGAVEEALDRAGCTGFVAALPAGPRTPIGERGLGLSAGQRQRLALARAFLRDAPLLLLDEPTAHLDPITAGGIRAAVDQLMADRTVLLVTHHRAWRSAADVVLTLRDGRLERVAEVVR